MDKATAKGQANDAAAVAEDGDPDRRRTPDERLIDAYPKLREAAESKVHSALVAEAKAQDALDGAHQAVKDAQAELKEFD